MADRQLRGDFVVVEIAGHTVTLCDRSKLVPFPDGSILVVPPWGSLNPVALRHTPTGSVREPAFDPQPPQPTRT